MVTGARWGKGAKVTYTKKYSVKPEAQLMMHHFLYAKRGVKVRFWCEKNFLRRRSAAVGAPHQPLTRRTPPRSEKNGFEPGFEPPFLDNFGRFVRISTGTGFVESFGGRFAVPLSNLI